jgi:phosphoserine phosphatase
MYEFCSARYELRVIQDTFFGFSFFVLEGTYSGRLDGELLKGPYKAQAAKNLASMRSYDLTRSFAYSDSLNDLPLLASVGTPYVVNPNSELARIARKNAWHELTPAA